MLTRLSLTGFKSWEQTGDVRLGPVTGIFGANSSGKTSLLQALLLLKQTADSADRGQALHFGDKRSLVDLGDFKTLVFGHDAERRLGIALDWKQREEVRIADATGRSEATLRSSELGFSAEIASANGAHGPRSQVYVQRMQYRLGTAAFGMQPRAESRDEYELFATREPFTLVREPGRVWPLPPPAKCYGFPDEVRARYQNAAFLIDLELALERRLKSIFYLGPLRAYPERQYPWSGAQPEDMGRTGERAIDALLASRERGPTIGFGVQGKRRVTLEEHVAEWLRKLGLIHSFRVDALAEGSQLYRVLVRKAERSEEVLITDVGFGVSQVLPVLVLCFYAPEGSTVILEQPEIHLHPSVQSGLADVFVDAWRTRQVQVIVESHSEHLLRRLMRRAAEFGVTKDGVEHEHLALYFCSTADQRSALTTLRLDAYGHIENWPQDFFGDEFGEMAEMTRAVQQRRRSAS